MNQVISEILEWGNTRGILTADPSRQLNKLTEELGELAEGFNKGNKEQIEDSLGDMFVVMTLFAKQNNLYIDNCIQSAYETIKEREGKNVDGIWVKQEDLKSPKGLLQYIDIGNSPSFKKFERKSSQNNRNNQPLKEYWKSAEQFDGSKEMMDKYGITKKYETKDLNAHGGKYSFTKKHEMKFLGIYTEIEVGDWIITGDRGLYWSLSDEVYKKIYGGESK